MKLTGQDAARYAAMNLIPRDADGSIEIHGPYLVVDDTTTTTETADHAMIQAGPDSNFVRIDDLTVIRALYDHPSADALGEGSYTVTL